MPLTHLDYAVGCICPMGLELAPAEAMLDHIHPILLTQRAQNSYTLGEMCGHNVVIAVMPEIGNNAATMVAIQLLNDFPSIRFSLLVGIGGGVPGEKPGGDDIRLGDVVVSKPTGSFGGVVQFDFGKEASAGFERRGILDKPPIILRSAVQKLIAQHEKEESRIPQHMERMIKRYPKMETKYCHPGTDQDHLFRSHYDHQGGTTCSDCDKAETINRLVRSDPYPYIHYGTIGSANKVIKNGRQRENLKKELKILCVEMEAAGLMDSFPCLIIRGICDYADSHKNKDWQPYAAAAAAAYMKELLSVIQVQETASVTEASFQLVENSLSISASITGLLTAGRQLASLINCLTNPPQALKEIETELPSLRIIISGLGKFVERTRNVSPARANLIPLQDVITVFTQLVLVYTELEAFLKTQSSESSGKLRTAESIEQDVLVAERLLSQVQRHKQSLSLVLDIIRCDSEIQARANSEALRAHTDRELEENFHLAHRVQRVELPPNTIVSGQLSRTPTPDTGGALKGNPVDVMEESQASSHLQDAESSVQISFREVLAYSRPYKRTRNLEIDAVSHISTTRSHGWSLLSGFSSSQVTTIGVICLPLTKTEQARFCSLCTTSSPTRPLLSTEMTYLEWKLDRYLSQMAQTAGIRALPVGGDRCHWNCAIFGPDTPYEEGVFFLSMSFPVTYPLDPPSVSFTDRIFHPNIDSTGTIGMDILYDKWDPAISTEDLLLSIRSLLKDPNPHEPLHDCKHIAHMYLTNRSLFEATARRWTRKYAV